ncbi:hypothetical protein ACOMHN_052232 [Nucella lapillus]
MAASGGDKETSLASTVLVVVRRVMVMECVALSPQDVTQQRQLSPGGGGNYTHPSTPPHLARAARGSALSSDARAPQGKEDRMTACLGGKRK